MRIPICLSLIAALSCQAQQVSGPKSDLVQSGGLKIVVVQGEGAENNLRTRNATQPVVEVRDDGDKPVPGAEVVFQLPPAGIVRLLGVIGIFGRQFPMWKTCLCG